MFPRHECRFLKRNCLALAALLGLMGAACQPGPPPTPTVPPQFDITPTPTWPSPTPQTPSPTPTVPSRTPTATVTSIAPPTATLIVATYTPSLAATLVPSDTPFLTPTPQPPAPNVAPTRPPEVVPDGPPPSPVGFTTPPAMLGGTPVLLLTYAPSGQVNPLPNPAGVAAADLPAAPLNPSFEGGQVEQGAMEVRVPQGWTAWWRSGHVDCALYQQLRTDGPCPALEHPGLAYRRPEFTVIHSSDPYYNDPPRVLGEGFAARFFCTYGVCIAGYMQRVRVTPGASYTLGAWALAWCNDETDRAHSQTETRDDRLNCELAVGLDPSGGTDPLSPAIVWRGANVYDQYTYLSTPPVVAQGPVMTLYLRGRSLWGLLHNDFHFDDVAFSRQ